MGEAKKTVRRKILYAVLLLLGAGVLFFSAYSLSLVAHEYKLGGPVAYDSRYAFTVQSGNTDFYYDSLNENEQKLYRMLHKRAEAIASGEDENATVDGLGSFRLLDYGVTINEAFKTWQAFLSDTPAFFFVSYTVSYGYYFISPQVATEFRTPQARADMAEKIEDSVEKVSTIVAETYDALYDDGPVARFKLIYDYVIENTFYAYDEKHVPLHDGYTDTIAGVLDGDGTTGSVCQGYANAVTYLSNKFSLTCITVDSENANHSENLVCFYDSNHPQGIWYYADATNDDFGSNHYTFFLRGRDANWTDFCKPTQDKINNYFISRYPKLSYSDHDGFVNYGEFYYRLVPSGAVLSRLPESEEVVIPAAVYGIPITGVQKVFGSSLKSLSISSPLNIDYTYFINCRELEYAGYDGGRYLSSGTNEHYAFLCYPYAAMSISIHPDTQVILGSAFTAVFPFMTEIDIPDSVEYIAASAFSGCSSLTEFSVPAGCTYLDSRAFLGCSNLSRIFVREGNPVYEDENNCIVDKRTNSLVLVCVTGGLTPEIGVSTIKSYAYCTARASLTEAYIPKSVTRIESNAFWQCTKLEQVRYEGTKAEWQKISKGDVWLPINQKVTIVCTDGSLEEIV